jgi:hypothetical protein
MIRNVCIHVENEQPLLADLFDLPANTDAGLLCTNVRMLDGKRPVFVDRSDATFFFPYHVIRFVEIPVGALDAQAPGAAGGASNGRADARSADDLADLPELRLPAPVGGHAAGTPAGDADLELDIDEEFLQRIRDI